MDFAQRKFNELDRNNTQSLDVDEAMELARWVYETFEPRGVRLNEREIGERAKQLIRELDKDGDAEITWPEFEEYFKRKSAEAQQAGIIMPGAISELMI